MKRPHGSLEALCAAAEQLPSSALKPRNARTFKRAAPPQPPRDQGPLAGFLLREDLEESSPLFWPLLTGEKKLEQVVPHEKNAV